MARVCYGEFDYPQGRSGRTAYLQNEFVTAVHRYVPEVWDELYSLHELFAPLISARLSWPVISGKNPLRVPRKVILKIDPQDVRTLKRLSKPQDYLATAAQALKAWADRWNLNEEWCLQRGYDALQWWSRHGKVDAVLWAGVIAGGLQQSVIAGVRFSCLLWRQAYARLSIWV